MSYSNYEPDDPQRRFHGQESTPYGQAAVPQAQPPTPPEHPTALYTQYDEPAAPYSPPYGQPPSPYAQPSAPYAQPYAQPAAPYAQPAAPYGQPPTPYAQPSAPYAQPAAPYAQPAPAYNQPAYPPPSPPAPPAPQQQHRTDTATIVARVAIGISGGVAFIFALHVLFSLTNANQSNGFVEFVYVLSKVFVLGFGDVFTPDDAKIGLVLNYGLAALVYLVIGRLIARALRH